MDLLEILEADGESAQLTDIESSDESVKVVAERVTMRGANLNSVKVEDFKNS